MPKTWVWISKCDANIFSFIANMLEHNWKRGENHVQL